MKKPSVFFVFVLFFFFACISNLQAQLTVSFMQTPYCNSNNPGTYCPVVTGGTPPYTYTWSDGTTSACLDVDPFWGFYGTFSLTVIDNMGLNGFGSVTVSPSTIPVVVNVHVNTIDETCNDANGMAWVDIAGGTSPYNITFGPSTGISNPYNDSIFNLSAGYYFVYVEDTNGCVGYDSLSVDSLFGANGFEINKILPYSYNITTTDQDCSILGTAAVHVTGGVPPISYEWSTVPPQYTDSVGGLFGGAYTVTISDGTAGCSVVEYVNIRNLNPINATSTSTPEICDYNNGTATVVPTSGTPPYTFLWNTTPPQTTATATNLDQGYYSCTFTDFNMCSGTRSVYVGYTSPVHANPVAVNEVCNDGSGSITLTPTLGTPPYLYQWSNSATSSAITGLSDGIYSFTVNDVQGCSVTGSKHVQDVPPFNANITYMPQTCLALGRAAVSVTGNTGPYTYSWNTTPPQTTDTANNLAAGFYSCTISDTNNCIAVKSVRVQYDPLVQASLTQSPALCLTSSGAVNVTVFGTGQPPYSYQWSNGASTEDISGVPSGYYSVTITDANGCSISKQEYVKTYSNMSLAVTTTNASCIFTPNGQAAVIVSNGTPPFQYHWGNGQTTQTATGLQAGWRYNVNVVDANGCAASRTCILIGYDSLTCAVLVHGKVVKDLDANCLFTPGDAGVLNNLVSVVPGYYDFTGGNGNYGFIIPPANYAINHNPPYHSFPLCPPGTVDLFGLPAGTDTTVDFYDTVRTALDLMVGFGYLTLPRPGFQHEVSVTYANNGNLNTTATLDFDYDPDVRFVSTTISGSNYVHDPANHRLIYTFNNMQPGYLNHFRITFYTPDTTTLGTLVKDCASIYPVMNDVNFIDNVECDSVNVVGSYDPNDKAVTPKGYKTLGYITREDSLLHYTIRFQNTGTYAAENIAILDTLDEDLDPSTIERMVSSHNFRADFFLNKYLAFYFDNILLPDSFSDESASHGYVSFYIKQRPMLPHGTHIDNRAAIYFDYNEPIITNTVSLIISAPTDIETIYKDKEQILAYPNPTSTRMFFVLKDNSDKIVKVELFDLSGKRCATSKTDQLNLEGLQAGMYYFQVFTENGKILNGKAVKE